MWHPILFIETRSSSDLVYARLAQPFNFATHCLEGTAFVTKFKIQTMQPISEFKSKSGLKRIYSAFFYSIDGFKTAWQQEHAFRQEMFLLIVGSALALSLPVGGLGKLLLIASLVAIVIVELLNSAIEAVVDRISLERHPLSKNAKDLGSAAVLLTCILALGCWGTVISLAFF